MFAMLGDVRFVSTHSRLKAAASVLGLSAPVHAVSTHSRLKAAEGTHRECFGHDLFQHTAA